MAIRHSDRTQTEPRGDRVHDMNDPVEKRRERNPDGDDDIDRDIAGDDEDELLDTDEDDFSER
jgi:hypothetical protein